MRPRPAPRARTGARGRLGQRLPAEARLEGGDQIGRRRPLCDLEPLNLLPGDLLLDRLQEPLPVLVLVRLGIPRCRGQLADQAPAWSGR